MQVRARKLRGAHSTESVATRDREGTAAGLRRTGVPRAKAAGDQTSASDTSPEAGRQGGRTEC